MLHSTLRMSGTLVSGAPDALPSPFRASMTKSNCATRPATVKQELRSSLPNSNWRNSEEWTGMAISPICYGYQAWYLKICKHLHIWSKMWHKLPLRCPCLEGIQADNSGILPSQHTPRPSHVIVVVVLIRFVMFGLKLHQTPSARLQLGHNLECGTGIANEVVIVFFPKHRESLSLQSGFSSTSESLEAPEVADDRMRNPHQTANHWSWRRQWTKKTVEIATTVLTNPTIWVSFAWLLALQNTTIFLEIF